MGSVGANTIFYNTGQFEGFSTDPNGAIEFNYAAFALDQGFNRRQEHIIQYWSPNVNGFVFRYAQTAGSRDETPGPDGDLDPVIRSTSLAYENGPFWAAATYQEHEDWAAIRLGGMESSDAESYRFAARYIMDLGDGMSIQISAMYEDLEYDFQGTASVDASMRAFGYGAGFNDEDPEDTGTDDDGVVDRMGHEDDDPGHFAKTYLGIEAGENALAQAAGPGGDITFEREAFLISGKVKFGGPLDFRFSYMDADDLEISCAECDVENDEWESTAADAWNVGLYYTMPAGTELRLTYSEVSNDANGTYGQGISGTGLGTPGGEVEMIAFGIVHWFD
jgi:predicted porin